MNFVMLLVLSVVWGGIVVVAAAGIQRLGLSGRTRQMMWRCAGLMLIAPFPVALIYACIGPDKIAAVWSFGEGDAPSIPVVLDELPAIVAPAAYTVADGVVFQFDIVTASAIFLAIGWLFRAFRARWAAKELRRITVKSVPVHSHGVLASAKFWIDRLALKRETTFRLMPGDYSPFTQGVLKPVVYLPHGLERELTREELALVVGHELMHIRRLDALWRPAERIVADILWFNPFAWMVRAELDRAREIACDEAMLMSKAPAKLYARALVAAARFAEGLPNRAPAAAMFPFNKDKELTERVKIAIADGNGNSSFIGLAALGLFLAAGLPLAAAQGAGGEKIRAPIPNFSETLIHSEKAKISSNYGKRKHPTTEKLHFHKGVDIAVKAGEPVHAPANGVVAFSGEKEGYGKVVHLNYNAEWASRFAQLSEILVVEGQTVQAGDVIGLVGQSGVATGPHLHFEVLGPSSDFTTSGNQIAYDPERMGVALIPALALRAEQIRELGIVLPVQAPAPLQAPSAPLPPIAPAAPKVTGITYFDDGRVQVQDAGVVFIEFNPKLGNLIPRLVASEGTEAEKRKYIYTEPNGDKVVVVAGNVAMPDYKLGIWVNGGKIDNVEDWFEWRADIQEDIGDLAEEQADLEIERMELVREMEELQLEQLRNQMELEMERKADLLEREVELRRDISSTNDWVSGNQKQVLVSKVSSLEEAIQDLDSEIQLINKECDDAEQNSDEVDQGNLKELKIAKSAMEKARSVVYVQLSAAILEVAEQN